MLISKFQYIISNTAFDQPLKNSKIFSHQNFHIQIHNSNSENLIIHKNSIFFGECFDFENPEYTHRKIVESINELTPESRIEMINRLSGQYIFIFFNEDATFIFNDAAGQLEVFIHHASKKLYVSSEPQFILYYNRENKSEQSQEVPKYIKENKINIFGTTPFHHISKLIPNFYYDVEKKRSERFFPNHPLIPGSVTDIAQNAIHVMEKIIESMTKRKRVALALTGGWDSRILFAASLKHRQSIDYFILNHKTKLCDIDIEIAEKISDEFSIKLEVIDYDLSENDLDHTEQPILWKANINQQKLAKIVQHHYPNHYIINGTVSEIAKNFYDPLPHLLSLHDISFITGVKSGRYETAAVSKWMETINDHLHILDYIQWENKMPNWAGSVRSNTNPYFTSISPFNNRYLLSLLLSTEREARDKYFHLLYRDILNLVNPRLTEIPVNPIRKQNWIKTMKKAGIYPLYRKALFKMRMLRI